MRTAARRSDIRLWSTRGARCWRKVPASPALFLQISTRRWLQRRGRIPSLQHGRRFEIVEPMAEPAHLHVVSTPDMIKYALACDNGHQFESWFQNSAAYDKQVKRKLVTCPICDSAKVEKAIMAPRALRQREEARRRMCRCTRADAGAPPADAPRRSRCAGIKRRWRWSRRRSASSVPS